MKICLYIIYAINICKINSSILVRTQKLNQIIHERLEKSKLGAVLYTIIPFTVFFCISLKIIKYFGDRIQNEEEGLHHTKINDIERVTAPHYMKTNIITMFIIFGTDVIIKLFINYYGKLSFFFRPSLSQDRHKDQYFIFGIMLNLFASPTFVLFVLACFDCEIIVSIIEAILPIIDENVGFILYITLIYVFICNVILPGVLYNLNQTKYILYKKKQTTSPDILISQYQYIL